MAHRSGTQTVAAFPHCSNRQFVAGASRAGAQHQVSSAKRRAQRGAKRLNATGVQGKSQEVKVGHGQWPCRSAATPPPSAPQAGYNAGQAKTAASPIRAGCARSRLRLQSVQRLALSQAWLAAVLANQSLNRTHCSRPQKARHFILGL